MFRTVVHFPPAIEIKPSPLCQISWVREIRFVSTFFFFDGIQEDDSYVHFANKRPNSTPNSQDIVLGDGLIHEFVDFSEDELDIFVGHVGLVF